MPIALEALKQGYEVHVLTAFISDKENIEKLGIKTHDIAFKRGSFNLINEFLNFLVIVYNLFKIRPNIVHLVTTKPIILGGLASKLLNIRCIVASISGLGILFTSKNLKIIIFRKIVTFFYRFIFYSSRNLIFIFQNKEDQNIIMKITNLKKSQMRLIKGSGVDLAKFKMSPIPKGVPIVLFAARLLKSKGIMDFIDAARIVKEARFVVAGKYDFENRDAISPVVIEKAVKENLIEYWGFKKDIVKSIQESTIVTLPSYYGEGLPKILIEAAACGRPVITTDHPGCRDAIKKEITGLLVPINSPILLSKAIKKIVNNSNIIKNMSENARTFALENFDIKYVVKTHLEIYQELLKKSF